MVFYLGITVFQYNSQNGAVPMGPKQPGPTVFHCRPKLLLGGFKGEKNKKQGESRCPSSKTANDKFSSMTA